MVTLRAGRMPNATAPIVADCWDTIGLGPSCNMRSALSLMALRAWNELAAVIPILKAKMARNRLRLGAYCEDEKISPRYLCPKANC